MSTASRPAQAERKNLTTTTPTLPTLHRAPRPGFHLLAKPSGSTCNIDCTYCFFLSKEALYPNDKQRMSEATLETYIRQLLESHRTPQVTVAWQGGEPTLMGLDFFARPWSSSRSTTDRAGRCSTPFRPTASCSTTTGARSSRSTNFLVGLSVDGPRELHDAYRLDRGGQGTFDRVMRGWRHLRAHDVEFNVLCTVNAANQEHGREVYRFFRDELAAKWIQFIPIVERATADTLPSPTSDGAIGRAASACSTRRPATW